MDRRPPGSRARRSRRTASSRTILEDVGRVDAAREAAVEPQADHPAEPLLVAVEQGVEVGLARTQHRAGHAGCPSMVTKAWEKYNGECEVFGSIFASSLCSEKTAPGHTLRDWQGKRESRGFMRRSDGLIRDVEPWPLVPLIGALLSDGESTDGSSCRRISRVIPLCTPNSSNPKRRRSDDTEATSVDQTELRSRVAPRFGRSDRVRTRGLQAFQPDG